MGGEVEVFVTDSIVTGEPVTLSHGGSKVGGVLPY